MCKAWVCNESERRLYQPKDKMKSRSAFRPGKKNSLPSATLGDYRRGCFGPKPMNIQQISNNIDQKLAQLDQQLVQIHAQLASTDNNREQLLKDALALEQIKSKLQKSRNIMWQAHELERGSDRKRTREKHLFGLALLVISSLGLLGMLFLMFTN